MSLATLAVTGATGALGDQVARELAGRGVRQRLLARSPERAPALPGADSVRAAYEDRESARRALEGVTTLFMVSASETPDRVDHHRAFVDAAVDAGVGHVVYTSFYGAAPDCTFTLARDHWATEEHIRSSGLRFTFLRDNLYLDFLPAMVGEDGVLRGPAGDGRVAAVARGDVARSAVEVLLDPEAHDARTYHLTGPEALTLTVVAGILSQVTGREVTYHDETVEEAYASRAPWGAPDWQVDAWVSTYTAIRDGELAGVTDDVARLTGRGPLDLRRLLASAAS